MKKFTTAMLIVLLVFIMPSILKAQVYAGLNVGATQTAPLGTLQIGWTNYSSTEVGFFANYDQRISLTHKANVPSWFGISAGPVFELKENSRLQLQPGCYYRQVSSSLTNLNGWDVGGGVRYTYKSLSLEAYYLSGWYSLTIGWVGIKQ